MENSGHELGWKDADKPLLFYFSGGGIEIIKHREDSVPSMMSGE